MAIDRWLSTCAALIVVLVGLGHAAAARAAEILQIRAATHQDGVGPSGKRIRIVLDIAAARPGAAAQVGIDSVPAASGAAWTVRPNMPLSGRAEAQLRALTRRFPDVVFDLSGTGDDAGSVLTLRFERPTVLARHFVLPGRGGQQERVVLDFVPDTAPAPVVAAHTAAIHTAAAHTAAVRTAAVHTTVEARPAGASPEPGRLAPMLAAPATPVTTPHAATPVATSQAATPVATPQAVGVRTGGARVVLLQAAAPAVGAAQGQPGTVPDTEPGVFDAAPQTGPQAGGQAQPGGTPNQNRQPAMEQGEPGTVQGTEPGVFDTGPAASSSPAAQQGQDAPKGQGAPQAGGSKQPVLPPQAGGPTAGGGAGEPGMVQGTEPGVFDVGPKEPQDRPGGQGLPRPQAEPARALPMRNEDELPPPPTGASPLTLWGFFEAEGRWFPQDSRDGAPDHLIGSMAMEPTVEYSWSNGSQFLRFTGFARVDTVTENRTHADVREAKWVGVFGPLELTVGVDRRFWGVTEAVHLVNIINQVDTLEDVDFEDYLGQPLISAAYTTEFGTFSGFFMPYFRERLFPRGEDRPNLPVRVERELTQYESGDNNWHPDWALRWSLQAGPVDLGISHFSGFAREPRLLLANDGLGRPILVPRYDLIDQTGIDLQATLGAWLLKFEGIHQWNPVRDYAAFAAGFEYTIYGVSAAGADLGLLAEYLYDERGKGTPLAPGIPPFSGVSPYDDDVFLGLRWSGNDVATTELLAGAILDLDTKSKAFVVEASRRLGANLRISLDGRFFTSVSTRDVLYPLGDDDFLQLKLQWHY